MRSSWNVRKNSTAGISDNDVADNEICFLVRIAAEDVDDSDSRVISTGFVTPSHKPNVVVSDSIASSIFFSRAIAESDVSNVEVKSKLTLALQGIVAVDVVDRDSMVTTKLIGPVGKLPTVVVSESSIKLISLVVAMVGL